MRIGHGVGAAIRSGHMDAAYPLAGVRDVLAPADLRFCNLESVLSHVGFRPGMVETLELRGEPGGAHRLRLAGFDVVNIANNHILQHGSEAFRETVKVLEAQGLTVVGIGNSDGLSSLCRTVTVNGITVAFVGYALETDRYYSERPLYASGSCDILADVRRAKQSANVVVCSLHWGREFVRVPSRSMVSFAHTIVDAGADVILGHHPHVFQGIERYGRGLVVYSLGNFACDMTWDPALRAGLVVRVRMGPHGVLDFSADFVRGSDDYQPAPVSPHERAQKLEELTRLSAALANPPADDEYEREAARLTRRNRRQSYAELLTHLLTCRDPLTAKVLMRKVRRKLTAGSSTAARAGAESIVSSFR